ncbi:glycine zipper 2TM domain-containing protein [Tateyamaria sp.]|uniref:glycine zipper 2TM domain-containing protein n=1 Tax=Tateyamaria sp. TaxID=1929288 RepID=UPI00329B1EF9
MQHGIMARTVFDKGKIEPMQKGKSMKKIFTASVLCCAVILQACAPAATPQQQAQRQHNIACATGTIGGALIGGAIGNQFGGGTGRDIFTASGAGAGALAGQAYAC